MPDKEPIILKLAEGIALKCIYVPPGKFMMGEPFYQCRHLPVIKFRLVEHLFVYLLRSEAGFCAAAINTIGMASSMAVA